MTESERGDLAARSGTAHALYLISSKNEIHRLFGLPPSEELIAQIANLPAESERAILRSFQSFLLLKVPLSGGQSHIWLLKDPGQEHSVSLVTEYRNASQRIEAAHSTPAPNPSESANSLVSELLRAMADQPWLRRSKWLKETAETVSHLSGWPGIVLIERRSDAVWKQYGGDESASKKREQLSAIAKQLIDQNTEYVSSSDPFHDVSIECFVKEHHLDKFALFVPRDDGIGIFVETEASKESLEAAALLAAVRTKPANSMTKSALRKPFLVAATVLVLLFLLWPVPMEIGAPGTLRPANSQIVIARQSGRLVGIDVQVGDFVKKGQQIARLMSPELEEEKTRADLDSMLENLNAKEALAQGDYASYQITEQRGKISSLRVEQANRRLIELTLTAPVDGRIADVLPLSELGSNKPLGSFVAEIQQGLQMHVLMRVSRADGPWLSPGMTGSMLIRGIVDRNFRVELISEPAVSKNKSGDNELLILARLDSPEINSDANLVKGLTGYVRIEGETSPRLLNWCRPLWGVIRLKLWKYLGLPL